jgi:hypothetical protein
MCQLDLVMIEPPKPWSASPRHYLDVARTPVAVCPKSQNCIDFFTLSRVTSTTSLGFIWSVRFIRFCTDGRCNITSPNGSTNEKLGHQARVDIRLRCRCGGRTSLTQTLPNVASQLNLSAHSDPSVRLART